MKRLSIYLLTLCLLVCLAAFQAPKAQAATHSHCVCGGDANGIGDHVCADSVTWQPWDGTTTLKNGGHYYLNDTDGDGVITLSSTVTIENKHVSLCLNGVELTSQSRIFLLKGTKTAGLNICDCSATKQGTISSTAAGIAPILHSYTNKNASEMTINLYGGHLVALDNDATANSDAGVLRLGNNTALSGSEENHKGVFNMYSGSISGGQTQKCGGNVYVSIDCEFNMYGGIVSGGYAADKGGNFFVSGHLKLLGGQVTGGSAPTGGGIYLDERIDRNGQITLGGTARVVDNAVSNIYLPKNKTITVETMASPAKVGITLASGNVFATTDNPNNAGFFFGDNGMIGAYTDGNLELIEPQNVTIMSGNAVLETCSLSDAISKVQPGQYLKLQSDLKNVATLPDGLYLDLNGHHLSGVTINGTLYAFDSATDSFEGNHAGSLSYTGNGTVCTELTTNITGEPKRYISLTEENGLSFHRIYVGITTMTLRPSQAGMGYIAQYRGDEAVQAALASNKAYGYELWLDGYAKVSRGKNPETFTGNDNMTLGLNNIMTQDSTLLDNIFNADTQVHAVAYIKLADGRTLRSSEHSKSLKEIATLADQQYDQYTDAKQSALQDLYTNYKSILLAWDLPNTIHNAETWTSLNQENFVSNISTNGQYQLTSDIDLADTTITITSKNTVTLCLNGYTISGTNRLFKVYGTLNICDCHTNDQEGTLTSSYTGDYAPVAYLYQAANLNLYGGNLTATGKVAKNGGVLAIGNTNGMDCRFNMFGGRIYGGVTKDAGLVWVLNTSTMNMYGGELYGGIADGNGGGIYVGAKANANLYGGKISNCRATGKGGAVYTTSGQARLYIGSRLVMENNSAHTGGHIYHYSDSTLHISGATLTQGNASLGGGVYSTHAPIILSGNTIIRDNPGGNLYLTAGIALDTAGLTQDADVHIYNVSSMILNADFTHLTLEREGYKVASIGGQTVLIPENFTIPTDVEGFQVGFGRADITPTETGLPLAGYGNSSERLSTTTATNEYDELKVSCVAITDEAGETVLIMSVDLIRPGEELMATIFPAVSAATGVPESHIFTTFTHTHSVPETKSTSDPGIQRYNAMLPDRFAESANQAMADRAPATMETGSFEVGDYGRKMNFTRHYYYFKEVAWGKGTHSKNWKTGEIEEGGLLKNYVKCYFGDNFGTTTIDSTTQHVTEADHTMHLVKFTREGKDILMANWRVHPHMTGNSNKTVVSADIIGTTRYYFEQDQDCHFIYLQGAAGNVNEKSKLKDEEYPSGFNYQTYGSELADQIQSALSDNRLTDSEIGLWQVDNYSYTAISDIPTEEEYTHAKNAKNTYEAWLKENPEATSAQKREKCEELGYLTWFHFNNVITRYNREETYQLPLNTFALGRSLAFYTAPGELWDTISMEMEEASPFDMTLCMGYSQDHNNYFVYDPTNGGAMTYESYESNNYRFVAPDTVKDFLAYWKDSLNEMYNNLNN